MDIVTDLMKTDLAKSGLIPQDLCSRPIDNTTMNACKLSSDRGYIIPYFSMKGEPLAYYRVKMFTDGPKYRQVSGTPNYIYYPLAFKEALENSDNKYIIITEGEKKAACACKHGFPTIALGGVDSWRNKVLILPTETDLYNQDGFLHAKLPGDVVHQYGITYSPVAVGYTDLINFVLDKDLIIFICYDKDTDITTTGLKQQVQRAASDLAFDLKSRGIPYNKVRQLCFPKYDEFKDQKMGLDDFLVRYPSSAFETLIFNNLLEPSCFPVHPEIGKVIDTYLSKPKLIRQQLQKMALHIICDLDARGKRMYCNEEDQLYYFDDTTCKLLKADLNTGADKFMLSAFSKYLYRTYNLSTTADNRVIDWLSTLYCSEEPLLNVQPERVVALPQRELQDTAFIQLSDKYFATVDKQGMRIHKNGSKGVLFEQDLVTDCDITKLEKYYKVEKESDTLPCKWLGVLSEVKVKADNKEQSIKLHALLYYLSPWLIRWRNMQLPVELIIGESGSGKSTLYELRLNILSGKPKLRNTPNDLRDWQASIANSGGLHITDNIQMTDKIFKQKLSDELCRLVTEPSPSIEMRKLYKNAELYTIPVKCIFGFTGINNPFTANDLNQRSMLLELDKSVDLEPGKDIQYDSVWKFKKLEDNGGREGWLAHHFNVLEKFFQKVAEEWDDGYKSKCRLVHFEQALRIMARVFKLDDTWIPDYLSGSIDKNTVGNDWTLEGITLLCNNIREFISRTRKGKELPDYLKNLPSDLNLPADKVKCGYLTASAIVNWAECHDDYNNCVILTNARRLGKYLSSNKASIMQVCKLSEIDITIANKKVYQVFT